MRIIAGRFRGKKIDAPANLPVRPTTDFAKTALFNILTHSLDLSSCNVLDLYAGTGNITYEFISRQVRTIAAVDKNRACCHFIEKTIAVLQAEDIANVMHADALLFLASDALSYDIIFADPPFEHCPIATIHDIVFTRNLLGENGMLIVEHSSKMKLPLLNNLKETRTYGAVAFSIFVQDI